MEYFECNLPVKAPLWLHSAAVAEMQRTLDTIHGRMKRLEEALALSGMDGATFSRYARILFENRGESFDRCTPEDISSFVKFMDDGTTAEPRLEWPNSVTVVDTAFVFQKEWESIRRLSVGGSEAAVVLGLSPYQNASSLYHGKVGTPQKLPLEQDSEWVFERGHLLEDRVIDAFCKTAGARRVPETRMFASKTHPCCSANIDQIVRFSDGRLFVFEAKTTIANNWLAWSENQIPAHYVPQTRQYPAVLDDERICGTYIGCIFTSDKVVSGTYIGAEFDERKFVCRFVARDPEAEEQQLEAEETWFSDYVQMNMEPPMTGKPYDARHPRAGELQVLQSITGPADPNLPVEHWGIREFESDILHFLETKEQMSELQAKLNKLDEVAKSCSLPMIARLGERVEANVDFSDGRYYEIKNAPRPKTTVDMEKLLMLFNVLKPYLPQELEKQLRSCVEQKTEAYRVFTIREKRRKTAKRVKR